MTRSEALSVLGLKEGYSASELKKAYRQLARQSHPDVFGEGKAEEFKKIKDAYELISKSTLVYTGMLLTHGSIFKIVKI